MNIDIGIITYKRNDGLINLLKSIELIDVKENWSINIIIVDNDCDRFANIAIENYFYTYRFNIIYDVECNKGISYARNRVLDISNADYLAFIDDDELVTSKWLINLVGCLLRYKADIVFGPVYGVLPKNSPKWALTHPSFNRPPSKSGKTVEWGGSGNVLLALKSIKVGELKFNHSFALTGGSDTELFYRAFKKGLKLVWCEEALAYEVIPKTRINVKWVLLRGLRGGQGYARIYLKEMNNIYKTYHIIIRILIIIPFTLYSLLLLITKRSKSITYLTKIAGWIGQITALLIPKYMYNEYK